MVKKLACSSMAGYRVLPIILFLLAVSTTTVCQLNHGIGTTMEMDVSHCYLDGNVDAVEFCPHPSYTDVLAASTYTLQEGNPPTRLGSISLFKVNIGLGNMELFYNAETAGIFDIKWKPVSGDDLPMLAQADSDGFIRIYTLQCPDDLGHLKETVFRSLTSSSSMCLCLDLASSGPFISSGLSDGSISVLSLSDSDLRIQQQWTGHDFEVWATSFDPHNHNLLYTGSDDCSFCCWDLRANPSSGPTYSDKKTHRMGVCSVSKSPGDPYTILTGCYDERLRVWDTRHGSRPVETSSVHLGGGVWRVKHHPVEPDLVLAACMHNGFAVLRRDGGSFKVMETYAKHTSLAYGADWKRGVDGRVVATCSFYDKLVRVWRTGCH